jgi:hypothetical protein
MSGQDAPKTWEEGLDAALAMIRETMIERHTKYGPGNIAMSGELGVAVRTGDKVARLLNMHQHPDAKDFQDDSVLDAYTDLGGYGTIGIMLRLGYWKLPAHCLGDA